MFSKGNFISIEQFYEMREKENRLMEYVDGVVYMSPSPSIKHQKISMKLSVELSNFLKGKDCDVFHAPTDIQLHHEDIKEDKIVIPDIAVICDKSGFEENKYVGVPTLIMEILSPSNQAHDLVFKLNLYMQCGVKEYWIVNPIRNIVQTYVLNDERQYEQMFSLTEKGVVCSEVLRGFEVELEGLFL